MTMKKGNEITLQKDFMSKRLPNYLDIAHNQEGQVKATPIHEVPTKSGTI